MVALKAWLELLLISGCDDILSEPVFLLPFAFYEVLWVFQRCSLVLLTSGLQLFYALFFWGLLDWVELEFSMLLCSQFVVWVYAYEMKSAMAEGWVCCFIPYDDYWRRLLSILAAAVLWRVLYESLFEVRYFVFPLLEWVYCVHNTYGLYLGLAVIGLR